MKLTKSQTPDAELSFYHAPIQWFARQYAQRGVQIARATLAPGAWFLYAHDGGLVARLDRALVDRAGQALLTAWRAGHPPA
jgi:hypothetical protein